MLEFAISTRGASAWVRKTPTGLPDWTSSVSSSWSSRNAPTMRSKLSQSRAARPMPPYTTSSCGFSATSGSRLFISIRNGASVSQLLADLSGPRGARMRRALSMRVRVIASSFEHCDFGEGHADVGSKFAVADQLRRERDLGGEVAVVLEVRH